MRNHDNLKASLDLVHKHMGVSCLTCLANKQATVPLYGRREVVAMTPIARLQAQLWSPRIVALDTHYNTTGVRDYMV